MKFSIIVPIYNSECYLEKCINSLLYQKIDDYEIILINDCSTDNSKNIIEKNYGNLNNVVILNNEVNVGLSSTRNKGIDESKGDYLLFVDSDDYIDNNTLSDLLIKLKENDYPDVLYFGFYEEDGNMVEQRHGFKCSSNKLYHSYDFMKIELKKRNLFAPACFAIYKRNFINKNKLKFEKGLLHEDELWTPNVLASAKTVYVENNCYYHYIRHNNSITRSKDTTKNGIDLKTIAHKVDDLADKMTDEELKILIREHSARLYMRALSVGRLYRKEYKKAIDRRFPIKRTKNLYDKTKSIIFFINLRLYYYLNYFITK